MKKCNQKLTLLPLMESIIKVDLYGKNSVVDSTVPLTPELKVGVLGLGVILFWGGTLRANIEFRG